MEYFSGRYNDNEIIDIMSENGSNIAPSLYGLLQSCQPTTASVERSFSMLKKLLAKDRHFQPQNIHKYFKLYYNKAS